MDFHGMKRKDLQALCKKHGIPANLKNIEMASRLASVFQEETVMENRISPEDSVEAHGIQDNVIVSGKGKKVTFSPVSEVCEFTRSVKRRRKNVTRTQEPAQDHQQGGVELRRSTRIIAKKGITVAGSSETDSNLRKGIFETEKECSGSDVTKAPKVRRRSKRICSGGSIQENCEVTDLVSKVEKVTRRSKRLGNNVDVSLEDENVKAVEGDDLEVEKAPKQSMHLEKGDGKPKNSSGNDGEGKKLLRRSKRTAQDDIPGHAMGNSSKECSVIDYGRDRASVDDVKKLNGNDEMQVRVRVTRNSSRHDSDKAPIVVEWNLVEKKTDDSLVKSPKRVSKRKRGNRSAKPGMVSEIATTQSNLTLGNFLEKHAEFEQEVGGTDVEARGSSEKSKIMTQECVKDKPQGMVENLPSFSETKATESIMLAENVLESSLEKPVDSSQRTNTQELNSELVEGEREEKLERDTVLKAAIEEEKEEGGSRSVSEQQNSPVIRAENVLDSSLEKRVDSSQGTNNQELNSELVEGELERNTVLMAAIEEEKEEVASRSVVLIEHLQPASVQLAEAELVVPTGHLHAEDIASTAIAEENSRAKDDILVCTPRSEFKEHSSVAKLAKVAEIPENSSKYDEKGSLLTKVQAADLRGNFSECNTEGSGAEEEMEISKVGCMSVGDCVNLTTEKLLDEYPQLESEEASSGNVEAEASSEKMKAVDQEFVKDKPHGMDEGSPSTFEIKATEPVMIPENVVDSTPKVSGDVSLARNNEELNSEPLEEREEKHEQDTVLMAATKKDTEETSSLFKGSETNLLPATVQLAMGNPEGELGVPTGHIIAKDIVSAVIVEENIKTKDQTLICTPISERKEQSLVAKLAKGEAVLKKSAECCKEIHSRKDDEKGSLENEIQASNLHGESSEYSTGNSSAEEQAEIIKVGYCVNKETLDEVRDDNLEKSERTISRESGWSTGSASLSLEETNVSECFVEGEMKALSQPIPIQEACSSDLHESAVFTTPKRNLILMEQLSENGKTRAADSVTHHSDKAVESPAFIFTTPEQVLFLGGSRLDEAGKEKAEESAVENTTEKYLMMGGSRQNKATNEGECVVSELHDESDIATSPVKQSSVGNFRGDGEDITVELHCESGACTIPDRHVSLGDSVSGGAEKKAVEFFKESVVDTSLETRELFGSFGQDKATEGPEQKAAQFSEESGLSTDQSLADSELGEAGWREINGADKYADSEQKKAIETGEKAGAEFHDESTVLNISETHPFPEDSESYEAVKSEAEKAVELEVGGSIFDCAEKHLLLDTGDNPTAKSHVVSGAINPAESQSRMGDSEPDEGEKNYSENQDMELLGESSIFTSLERHLLSEDSEQDGTRKIGDNTVSNSEESSIFTSLERRQLFGSSEPRNDGLDAMKGTLKQSRGNSPRVASINLCPVNTKEAETILEDESDVSYVLALPAKGYYETGGETPSHLKVAGTCSMVSEESCPLTDIKKQTKDALEEVSVTDNNGADELTKNTQKGSEGNLLLDSSGGFYASGKTCVLAVTEDEHSPIPTANEKVNSPALDESTVQNYMNEKETAADEEMVWRESTPSPEETLNESTQGQVRSEPNLIYRTQVKPKRDDMKENAPNSKIVQNLNITAPRTSKRFPLQDLRKN